MSGRALAALLVAAGCGASGAAAPDDAALPLAALPGPSRYALVGETVTLDGSASTGAVAYQWTLGDGSTPAPPGPSPRTTAVYASPGRYQAVLAVFDGAGNRRTAAAVISVTDPPVFRPRRSSSVAVDDDGGRVAVVSPDSNELMVAGSDGAGGFAVLERRATCAGPRTVTAWRGSWAVACPSGDDVELLPIAGGAGLRVALPAGARPFGVVGAGDRLLVSLQGPGALATIFPDGSLGATLPAIVDARGVALLPDGRVAVTRWRSPPERGELAIIDPAGALAAELVTLAFDPQPASNTESGGVPTWLEQVVVSPTGREAVVPFLQANVGQGLYRNGRALQFDQTVRAAVGYLDLATGREDFDRRKLFDNRGLSSAAALTSRGDFLFVAQRGNRTVERLDLLTDTQSGSLTSVGLALAGLAISADDRWLFVDAYLSRRLLVYDLLRFDERPPPSAALPIPASEPLSPEILLGKQLFNDCGDPRLDRDGYIACAHCHLDGDADGLTWDFTDRGEGLRNTVALLGRAGGDGPLHLSGNFDELQDFEGDIRGPFQGHGLMRDADWSAGTRSQPLGDPKAGLSPDLDALAAYVRSLDAEETSPFGGGAAADRGRALFESPRTGCAACHAGPRLTDSRWLAPGVPLLHDVGTLGPGSGHRLGGPLAGIDTPTLRGLWHSAPYLHDGSAATLREVLTTRNPDDRHGGTSGLAAGELDDLLAYLRSL